MARAPSSAARGGQAIRSGSLYKTKHRCGAVCTKRTKQGVSPRLGQAIEPKKNADARPTLSY